MSRSFTRRCPYLVFAIPALLLIYIFTQPIRLSTLKKPADAAPDPLAFPADHGPGPRIRQATMLYEGDKDKLRSIYVRSVETHIKHGQKWGYPTHVLARDLVPVEGKGGYFNKPAYLLNLIMTEMAKPESERAEWIVWFDGDSIIMNPSIPWSLFLPPQSLTDIHVLGTRDENGFNAGMLLIRVHPWTVSMLAQVLAVNPLLPDTPLPFYDQSAISYVCNLTSENRDRFLFQPRHWWNRYFFTKDGEERGEFLLHFAGVGTGGGKGSEEKERVMRKYLEIAEGGGWETGGGETRYEGETGEFWGVVRRARVVLGRMGAWWERNEEGEGVRGVRSAEKEVREALWWGGDEVGRLGELVGRLEGMVGKVGERGG